MEGGVLSGPDSPHGLVLWLLLLGDSFSSHHKKSPFLLHIRKVPHMAGVVLGCRTLGPFDAILCRIVHSKSSTRAPVKPPEKLEYSYMELSIGTGKNKLVGRLLRPEDVHMFPDAIGWRRSVGILAKEYWRKEYRK